MKSLFKKSLKVSFASVVAIKACDFTYKKFNLQIHRRAPLSEALYEDTKDDIINSLMKEEFEGDLSHLKEEYKAKYEFKIKTRDEHLKEMMDPTAQYDVLIVGGGASGAGVALEASSRGLKCAVIDRFDFASGTSSRSTKMAHGGIRYFEMMMFLYDPYINY
jgi:heterodisulfide reductase subunit A-like polyferredoxin